MSELVHPEKDVIVEAWSHHVLGTGDLHDTVESALPISATDRQQRIRDLAGLDLDPARLAAPDQLITARRPYQDTPVAYVWAGPSACWSVQPKEQYFAWYDYGIGVTPRPGQLECWFGDLPAGSQSLVTIKLTAASTGQGVTGILDIRSSGGSPPTTLRVERIREHLIDIVMRPNDEGPVLAVVKTKEGMGLLYFHSASLTRVS